jgi:hypothetical protein
MGRLAGHGQERRGRSLAEPEAGAAQPGRRAVGGRGALGAYGPLEVVAEALRAGDSAGQVVADVYHDGRPRRGGEEGVEGGDAVGLGRRDGEAPADVAEAGLDPADPRLERVEGRQQQVALCAGGVSASGDPPVDCDLARTAIPTGRRRSEHGIDRGPFGRGCERPDDVQVHARSVATDVAPSTAEPSVTRDVLRCAT